MPCVPAKPPAVAFVGNGIRMDEWARVLLHEVQCRRAHVDKLRGQVALEKATLQRERPGALASLSCPVPPPTPRSTPARSRRRPSPVWGRPETSIPLLRGNPPRTRDARGSSSLGMRTAKPHDRFRAIPGALQRGPRRPDPAHGPRQAAPAIFVPAGQRKRTAAVRAGPKGRENATIAIREGGWSAPVARARGGENRAPPVGLVEARRADRFHGWGRGWESGSVTHAFAVFLLLQGELS